MGNQNSTKINEEAAIGERSVYLQARGLPDAESQSWPSWPSSPRQLGPSKAPTCSRRACIRVNLQYSAATVHRMGFLEELASKMEEEEQA